MHLPKPQILKRIKRREEQNIKTLGNMIYRIKKDLGNTEIDDKTLKSIINQAVKDVQEMYLESKKTQDFENIFYYLNN